MSQYEGQIYECVEAFTKDYDGYAVTVTVGERVREGHPLLDGTMMFFRPMTVQYDIERATRAPGEKRGEKAAK